MKLEPNAWRRIALEFLVFLSAVLMLMHPVAGNEYRRYVTDTISYMRATVLEVQSEVLEESKLGTGQQLGSQHLLVRLSDGHVVELDNYLTETHNVLATEGSSVIVCADIPEHAEPYYTVYNYDRFFSILGIINVS